MNRVRVKPKPNKTVYDPVSKRNIEEAGAMVIFDSYWNRRLLDDEIEVIESMQDKMLEKSIDEDAQTSQNSKRKRGKK